MRKAGSWSGTPGRAAVSNESGVPGIATFSGAGACGHTAPSSGIADARISASIDGLLSLGRVDVGHFRPDLVEVERTGLEERMGHVDLELASPALLERRAHRALVVAVRQHGINDAEAGLVLGIL